MARTPSQIYVDPSIAGDSGDGSIGDPYGDLEYAIEQETFDTTNGTQINVKSGTDEILAASLDNAFADTGTTVAWVPTAAAPVIIRGYNTTANDGGKGGISGGGSVGIVAGSTYNGVWFVDMHLHNCGAADIVDVNDNCGLINCEVDNTTGHALDMDAETVVFGCYIHNIGGLGVSAGGNDSALIAFNYFENGTNDFTYAIFANANDGWNIIYRNIIKIDGTSNGIGVDGQQHFVVNNSIWSNGGTGAGIIGNTNARCAILNNLIEGFSGAGGDAIDLSQTDVVVYLYGGNGFYDNTTDETFTNAVTIMDLGSNESLSESPFTDAVNGDFSPVDTGNVKEGALPADFGDGQ